jgi:hypothetical protein
LPRFVYNLKVTSALWVLAMTSFVESVRALYGLPPFCKKTIHDRKV